MILFYVNGGPGGEGSRSVDCRRQLEGRDTRERASQLIPGGEGSRSESKAVVGLRKTCPQDMPRSGVKVSG